MASLLGMSPRGSPHRQAGDLDSRSTGALHRIIAAQDEYIHELESRLAPGGNRADHRPDTYSQGIMVAPSQALLDVQAENQGLAAEVETLRLSITKKDVLNAELERKLQDANSRAETSPPPTSENQALNEASIAQLRDLCNLKDDLLDRERERARVVLEQNERENIRRVQVAAEEAEQLRLQVRALENSLKEHQAQAEAEREGYEARLTSALDKQAQELKANLEQEKGRVLDQAKKYMAQVDAAEVMQSAEWNQHVTNTMQLIALWEKREATFSEEQQRLRDENSRLRRIAADHEHTLLSQVQAYREQTHSLQRMIEERERLAAESVRGMRDDLDLLSKASQATENHLKDALESRLDQDRHMSKLEELRESLQMHAENYDDPANPVHESNSQLLRQIEVELADLRLQLNTQDPVVSGDGVSPPSSIKDLGLDANCTSAEIEFLQETVATLTASKVALQNENMALHAALKTRNRRSFDQAHVDVLNSRIQSLQADYECSVAAHALEVQRLQSRVSQLYQLQTLTLRAHEVSLDELKARLESESVRAQTLRLGALSTTLMTECGRLHKEVTGAASILEHYHALIAQVDDRYQSELLRVRQSLVSIKANEDRVRGDSLREIDRLTLLVQELMQARVEDNQASHVEAEAIQKLNQDRFGVVSKELAAIEEGSHLVDTRSRDVETRLRDEVRDLREALYSSFKISGDTAK